MTAARSRCLGKSNRWGALSAWPGTRSIPASSAVLTPNGSGGYTRSEFTNDVGAVVNMTFGPSPQGQGLYYTNYTNGGEIPTTPRGATPWCGSTRGALQECED